LKKINEIYEISLSTTHNPCDSRGEAISNSQNMLPISYQPIEHKKQKRILVKFDYNTVLIKKLKETTDAKWSTSLKAWHIADTETNRVKCKLPLTKKDSAPTP
jgi:hypothetical protein